jgi:cytochrome P450
MVNEKINDKNRTEGEDMLSTFLSNGITDQEAIYESMITILGGSDTMSIALRSCLLFSITNPRIYNTLVSEILSHSLLANSIPSSAQLRNIPYLQATIKESLCIFPRGTGQMPKLAPPSGDILNGVFIPGGTNVGTNPWYVMRDPVDFGPDASLFIPEGWINVDEERRKEMEYVWELVWGYGKYKCLGQGIALAELGKVVFQVS